MFASNSGYSILKGDICVLQFQARVTDKLTGKETDRPLDITVLVLDLNDNPPTFLGPLEFQVVEQSRPGQWS